MGARRDPNGSAADCGTSRHVDWGTNYSEIVQHPRSENIHRRLARGSCVRTWRAERDWSLLTAHRELPRGHIGQVVAL